MTESVPFVDIRNLTVTFTGGKKPVHAVGGVDLQVERGEVVALMGRNVRNEGVISARLGSVALSHVFEGVQLLLGDRLRSTSTVFSVEGPELSVIGDQGRLEQVLVNLIQNALDAMGSGGAIKVSVFESEGIVTLRITDTGPGIPQDVSKRLFQPFTSSKDDGLGLGLVICRDIMIDLGGDLALVPGGHGATFAVTLKLAR